MGFFFTLPALNEGIQPLITASQARENVMLPLL